MEIFQRKFNDLLFPSGRTNIYQFDLPFCRLRKAVILSRNLRSLWQRCHAMEKRSRPSHDIFDSDLTENQKSYQKIDR